MGNDEREGWLATSASFTAFYRARSEPLLVWFARRVCDAEVALDLAAETFARAYDGRATFRGGDDDAAGAWLYGIARNLLRDWYRRGRCERSALARLGVDVPALADAELARIEELAGLEPLRGAVAAGLRTLSRDQREALRMRIVEELPYDEVARRLGVSEQTTRMRVSRGLRALAGAIDPAATAEEVS
ncbi:RNA polymerase sigma factor [Conexibacter arvalis]|uniref:RNA polymerase sigma-70 factor (ECF subfamily) n=1 Tax=Conexibacter arvalis TaxID=912552 RepID=A0A840IF86_9ACTN|nr:RNA polymerase sigma factor [Conexibacter arvalis]MBB4663476.1 RNA polymerase sigma-70 factor (ECF subfamily) [Conexibacter arvalis]